MVKPEEFAPRLRWVDWRGWGVVAVDLCAAGSVYPPLHRHMRIRVLLGPSLLHSGVSPTRLCLPQGGPSLRHQEKEAPPLHVESFLWESNLCLLLLSMSLSMSVSLCLDLPRKHEGWSIMAGQYFYSRLISVDPIHVFSLITQ